MLPWSHPPSKKQLTRQLTCGIKLTWIQMMFSRFTRNWNCLKASTKGMPSMSPITPPSCQIHRDGNKCIQKPRNSKSVMQTCITKTETVCTLYTTDHTAYTKKQQPRKQMSKTPKLHENVINALQSYIQPGMLSAPCFLPALHVPVYYPFNLVATCVSWFILLCADACLCVHACSEKILLCTNTFNYFLYYARTIFNCDRFPAQQHPPSRNGDKSSKDSSGWPCDRVIIFLKSHTRSSYPKECVCQWQYTITYMLCIPQSI